MGQVILPGATDQQGRKRVWMPPGATQALLGDVISRCDIPTAFNSRTGEVRICGARFIKGEERRAERHHATCAVENESVIRLYLDTRHPEIMQAQDREYEAWLARNRAAIMEGRVKW
jgi:hypothetical protein